MHEGIYEQLINKTIKNEIDSLPADEYLIDIDNLHIDDAKIFLANYIADVTRQALMAVQSSKDSDRVKVLKQIRVCNDIIQVLGEHLEAEEYRDLKLDENGKVLKAIYSKINNVYALSDKKLLRPETSLSQNFLFTASQSEPMMLEELKKEIASADEILWLVSFIKWTGIRNVIHELKQFTSRGGKLRVITTTYMEATDYKAIEELSKLQNTEIKVSLDKRRTRLHAKAYLFKRKTEFSSAYIGSSNISSSALTAGLEWNMKVTEQDSSHILKKFMATFEMYWNDPEFILLSKENKENWSLFRDSLETEAVKEGDGLFFVDMSPYPYQGEILDELEAERTIYGRKKNLVVAATGVGKTVISAFDFKRYYRQNPQAKLLFIAHREEILKQSLHTFRMVLRDGNFGSLFVGSHVPQSIDHLFMSVQSWNSRKMNELTTKDYYDFIIVDEFHHAAAPTYRRLLEYYEPDILLGLTATPERMDQQSILHYFDDYIAAEMRLKEAIDRNLLSPFHYYCVTDNVDLSGLRWTRRGYDTEQLTNVYTANDHRSNLIIRSVHRYVTDIADVKGLGFCVSVEHAKYMAAYFNKKGIPSIALHGGSTREERSGAQSRLVSGDVTFIFVVDLYNEGVDIPEVNTVLFLRPTESLTVFLQQLGRGLRLHDDKECLTVLDFIGQAHKDYPFEEKFRALVGPTGKSIRHYVEHGFSQLPKGSVIQMERQAKEYVLRNVEDKKNNRREIVEKIKNFSLVSNQNLTLENFLRFYDLSLIDLYGRQGDRSFERMKVEAGVAEDFESIYEEMFMKQIHKLFYIDSHSILQFYLTYIEDPEQHLSEVEERMLGMLYYSLFPEAPNKFGFTTMREGVDSLLKDEKVFVELVAVLRYLKSNLHYVEKENPFPYESPLRVHCHYTTDQILTAFGYHTDEKKKGFQRGVMHFKELNTDIFLTTLDELDNVYDNYIISDTLFHWQSQSNTKTSSPTGQRYINHRELNHQIAIFVREEKRRDGFASPFVFIGTADYVSHEGERPISFVWKLHEPLPAYLISETKKNIL